MTLIHDFVSALAVPGKSFKEIEETVKKVYDDKALKRTQIYNIMKEVKEGKPATDQRGFNTKRRIRNSAFVADIAARGGERQACHCEETCEDLWHLGRCVTI
jgi:hypothetical protein